jgi:hypothetical protein
MPGRLALTLMAAVLLSPGAALAEDEAGGELSAMPEAEQQLVARLGLAIGGRVTPGGLRASGSYLYQLADHDWFDGWLAFTFGGGDAECFRDRADELVCDHGALSGVGGELGAGLRRYFPGGGRFAPYVRGGAALRLVSFGDDELRGVAIPFTLAGGVSARVHRIVAVGAEAGVEAGPAWLGRGLGLEPQLGLVVAAAVEFALE